MPFSTQIVNHINEVLKAGSLSKEKLQPAKFIGLSTTIAKSEDGQTAFLPGVIEGNKTTIITPDDKHALIVYHKISTKTYGIERRSFGDESSYKSIADVQMLIYN